MSKLQKDYPNVLDYFERLCQTKPTRLFHYVSKDKAEYILKPNSDIYCGHSSRQNDPCEICVGCMEFLKFCSRKNALPPTHVEVLRQLLRYNFLDSKFKGLAGLAKFTPTMPYLFSVTPNEESPYQWRNYTDKKNGGYCFCFDYHGFYQALRDRRRGEVNVALLFAPCLYIGLNDGSIEELFLALLDDYKCEFEKYSRCNDPLSLPKLVQSLQGGILTIAPLIKHCKWAHESEWRLILVPGQTSCDAQYRPSGLSDTFHCSHPIDLMTSIKISPHGNTRDLRKHAESINIEAKPLLEESLVDKSFARHYIVLDSDKLNEAYEEYVLNHSKDAEIKSQDAFLSTRTLC